MQKEHSLLASPVLLPEGICLIRNQHGRAFLQIEHPAVSARIALEGAHITHCQPAGQGPLLWMSPDEPELPGKALRGGIPICWPWFGSKDTRPVHGIARTSLWELTAVTSEGAQVSVFMSLTALVLEQALPGEKWQLDVEFVMGTDLLVTLITRNIGTRPQALSQALHSYLPVSNIDETVIKGLENCSYFDQLTGRQQRQHGPLRFTMETDRIYFNHPGKVSLLDGTEAALILRREGSESLVVWNPWIEKSRTLGHFPADGYQTMLCLESANAGPDARVLDPGETHRLSSRITRVNSLKLNSAEA
ncbi:D-hexose-6-phosphate mutarotase [Halopseudomonas pelagia]|uniref:D-hexose-6-phosphate mutarotase n=1 Tax=Halopseudomonas pelagia TaxID=553151 RepID=UPI000A0461B5|nr:D-hexose-6-phosphate mutarotase [Halopseudomonas pelagia]